MKRKIVLITQPFIYLVAALLSVPLVLISVFVPVPVHTQADLAQVRLGLPLPFMIQNQTGYTPPYPGKPTFTLPGRTQPTSCCQNSYFRWLSFSW